MLSRNLYIKTLMVITPLLIVIIIMLLMQNTYLTAQGETLRGELDRLTSICTDARNSADAAKNEATEAKEEAKKP